MAQFITIKGVVEYHNMTPEEMESLTNSQSPEKASMEKPVQVRGQPPKIV